jgi:hypothetical protein
MSDEEGDEKCPDCEAKRLEARNLRIARLRETMLCDFDEACAEGIEEVSLARHVKNSGQSINQASYHDGKEREKARLARGGVRF